MSEITLQSIKGHKVKIDTDSVIAVKQIHYHRVMLTTAGVIPVKEEMGDIAEMLPRGFVLLRDAIKKIPYLVKHEKLSKDWPRYIDVNYTVIEPRVWFTQTEAELNVLIEQNEQIALYKRGIGASSADFREGYAPRRTSPPTNEAG